MALNGPIRVSENGRHFVDATGAPFFWLGDTAWPIFGQYTRDEAETYIDARAGKGFNVIQGVLAWGGGTGFETDAPGANYAGETPWPEGPARPNNAYFQNVDHLARYAAERDIVLAMLPTWGYYVNDVQTLNPDNARLYGRWLGERYRQRPNVIWVNGGDRIPTGHEATYRALAEGLREGDGGAHLITYHPCGWRSSAQFWHDEPWLDFNMIQTWTDWPMIYPAVAADRGLSPVKPVVLAEPAYETGSEYPLGPITPHVVRRQAWWAFMAGGFFTYGHNQNWRMEPGWLAEITSAPGATHMSLLRSIAGSRPWWKMIPDQSLFESGVNSGRTLNAALRSVDGQHAMIYLSTQCHALINVDKIEARDAKATLINPATGEERGAGTHATGSYTGAVFPRRTSVWFSVPGHWEDAVLILDAAA
jgi:hypothetical protein